MNATNLTFGLIGLALLAFPLVNDSRSTLILMTHIFIFAVFAMSYDLLLGYTGIVSFGHVMFFGIGAYTVALFMQLQGSMLPVLLLAVVSGIVLSGLVSYFVGILSLRLRSHFYAMLTLAFSGLFLVLGAMILQKGLNRNIVLESHILTDGSFAEDVIIPAGGTKRPVTRELLEQRMNYFDVPDPEGMKERLEQKSMDHFLTVIRESLHKSGYTERDIGYIGMLHMKKSAHDYILSELELKEEQSVYLNEYGHVGQIDQILSLELGVKEGKIKSGDIVVLVSAGIGYAWGALTLKWGERK